MSWCSILIHLTKACEDQKNRALGVVLSGTGSDGTIGLESIKAEGGITFAQDASAKFDSMPRSAIAAGHVDFVIPALALTAYGKEEDRRRALETGYQAHLTKPANPAEIVSVVIRLVAN